MELFHFLNPCIPFVVDQHDLSVKSSFFCRSFQKCINFLVSINSEHLAVLIFLILVFVDDLLSVNGEWDG